MALYLLDITPNQVHVFVYSEDLQEVGLRVVIGCATSAAYDYRKRGMVYVRNRNTFSRLGIYCLSKTS